MARFSTNKMGNGFFYFIPYKNEKYSLKILTPELNLTESLPDTKETGIILTYNNQLAENRVAIAIKTNKKGKLLYENKIFTVLIHQNGKAIQKQIGFPTDELESQFVFDKKYLPNGVSSIRLIDENLNEICERLLYHHANTKVSIPLEVKQTVNDSIQLLGKTEFTTTDLSISILPEESVCMPQKSSILGTFFLNAYLESPETDNFSYYDTNNNNRFNEMDLLMLNQNHSKYDWKNIKSNPPQKIYPFDIGVAIRGKVTDVLKPNANFKIALFSLKDNVSDETPLENNGEFAFENFYAKDSTVFLFQMMNTKNNVLKANMVARVNRNEPPCTFNLKTHKNHCLPEKKEEKTIVFTLPKSDNSIINLDEITVKNNYKKKVFVHKSDMSINSTAYKIGDREFGNVLDFITRHGYRIIQDSLNNVSVQSNRRTIPGSDRNPPAVYVDNDLVFDYSYLADVFLVDVDEIYIDQSGFSNTSMRNNGVIKIFLKKDRTPKNYFNTKLSSLLITKGFATCPTFKNTDFASQQAFYNFGTLYWSANFSTTEESKFQIQFPRDNQKAIQVLIEGFLEDGQFISEMKTIPISN